MTASFHNPPGAKGTPVEVFLAFLRLGCTSFGGPIAHFGYLRAEFVARRRWLDDPAFAELTALAQSLPGPASSQAGFTLGLLRAGFPGALAAWLGFTTPSAVLMIVFANAHASLTGPWAITTLHALQLVAVAVVAHAVLSMQRALAPNAQRLAVAVLGAAAALTLPATIAGIGTIALGAGLGLALFRNAAAPATPDALRSTLTPRAGILCLSLFAALLIVPALLATPAATVFSVFYRAGALVFGGGHVVLPLLESATVSRGWLTQSTVLTGYGATQALPGPLFTFAAYLGASLRQPPNHLAGALIALIAIFLPGLLLIAGILPFWQRLRTLRLFRAALTGINAAVVGLLAAALYRPVATTALHHLPDFALAATGLYLLTIRRQAPWKVVALTVAATLLLHAVELHLPATPTWLQI